MLTVLFIFVTGAVPESEPEPEPGPKAMEHHNVGIDLPPSGGDTYLR